jgi:hypothetical protein
MAYLLLAKDSYAGSVGIRGGLDIEVEERARVEDSEEIQEDAVRDSKRAWKWLMTCLVCFPTVESGIAEETVVK